MWLVFGKILISILGKVIEPITGNRPIREEFLALSCYMATIIWMEISQEAVGKFLRLQLRSGSTPPDFQAVTPAPTTAPVLWPRQK